MHTHTHILMAENQLETVPRTVDYKRRPAIRSKHGRWVSAWFLIWVEIAESIVFSGVSGNLMNLLTDVLGQSTAAAATNITAWKGVGFLLSILGATIADTYLGKYFVIVASSVIYIAGLGFLTLSTTLPSLSKGGNPERTQLLQKIIFFSALYLVAIGRSGRSPCAQAFGADQFDGDDPQERNAKSSFFNWWNFGVSIGSVLGLGIMSYVQDNLSWSLGFVIPSIVMVVALVIFLLGTVTYRYPLKAEGESPFKRIGRVFVRAARNWNVDRPLPSLETQRQQSRKMGFLDKALLVHDNVEGDFEKACSENEVEEAKAMLRLFPIWAMSFVLAIVFAQSGTLFIKQGNTMDRLVGSKLTIPSASLQCIMPITMLIVVPIYDYGFVPAARRLTRKPSGITTLQRVGTGLFITFITMVVSALVEKKRLQIALKHGLLDSPTATVPMSVWWLLPQEALFGLTVLFSLIGLQEFFYDQVPHELRSVGLAITSTIQGLGFLLNSILVSLVTKASRTGGRDSWISDNINRSHLDYFYWLLAGITLVDLTFFIYFAKTYKYKKGNVPNERATQ